MAGLGGKRTLVPFLWVGTCWGVGVAVYIFESQPIKSTIRHLPAVTTSFQSIILPHRHSSGCCGGCMTEEIDEADYYRRREQDHRKLADQASSLSIRNIHLDLADRYRGMVQEIQLRLTGQDRGLPPYDETAASP